MPTKTAGLASSKCSLPSTLNVTPHNGAVDNLNDLATTQLIFILFPTNDKAIETMTPHAELAASPNRKVVRRR